jgi:hypothetical protein
VTADTTINATVAGSAAFTTCMTSPQKLPQAFSALMPS